MYQDHLMDGLLLKNIVIIPIFASNYKNSIFLHFYFQFLRGKLQMRHGKL